MAGRLDFDRIARAYRWLEYLSFGPLLERCRCCLIPGTLDCKSALVLGDGDGRFLAKMLAANPSLSAEAIDISPAMLALLKNRAARAGASGRLRTHIADIRSFTPTGSYDLIATHFFLDCLTENEIAGLLTRLKPLLRPGAIWIVSEFAVPAKEPARWPSRLLVGSLYRAFGLLTGLAIRRLPDYASLLAGAGFRIIGRRTWLGGLLTSELWRLNGGPHMVPISKQDSKPVPNSR